MSQNHGLTLPEMPGRLRLSYWLLMETENSANWNWQISHDQEQNFANLFLS